MRLSGWVQTTDRLALREIAIQLNEQTGNIYLPSQEDDEEDIEPETVFSSTLPPATHLPTLISLLSTLPRPSIVILDAFDLFALHPRQSLLYCLLDTVQSCHAGSDNKGVAVIGLTTRMDSVNLLEKRVKSRFSGRMLRTASPTALDDWIKIAKTILLSEIPPEAKAQLQSWSEVWNAAVEKFLADESVLAIFNDTFSLTKDVRVLSKLLVSRRRYRIPSTGVLKQQHHRRIWSLTCPRNIRFCQPQG